MWNFGEVTSLQVDSARVRHTFSASVIPRMYFHNSTFRAAHLSRVTSTIIALIPQRLPRDNAWRHTFRKAPSYIVFVKVRHRTFCKDSHYFPCAMLVVISLYLTTAARIVVQRFYCAIMMGRNYTLLRVVSLHLASRRGTLYISVQDKFYIADSFVRFFSALPYPFHIFMMESS